MGLLGDRPLGFVVREAVRPSNWVALARMPRRYAHPVEGARRYFTPGGSYPYECDIRTPLGVVAPTLHSQHDMITVNEVFCREDYRVGDEAEVVVDVGSNIGISALYFLTRSQRSRIWLYEPVPTNLDRLRENLTGFEGRWRLDESAVADRDGEEAFSIEPSGRYGGLGSTQDETIRVRVRHIDGVLREVLGTEPRIDVLKLDTEGVEARTLAAVSPELLARIGVIFAEDIAGEIEPPAGFEASRRASVLRLVNRAQPPARRPPRSAPRSGPR
jgi:FkbM family methyltransferase